MFAFQPTERLAEYELGWEADLVLPSMENGIIQTGVKCRIRWEWSGCPRFRRCPFAFSIGDYGGGGGCGQCQSDGKNRPDDGPIPFAA